MGIKREWKNEKSMYSDMGRYTITQIGQVLDTRDGPVDTRLRNYLPKQNIQRNHFQTCTHVTDIFQNRSKVSTQSHMRILNEKSIHAFWSPRVEFNSICDLSENPAIYNSMVKSVFDWKYELFGLEINLVILAWKYSLFSDSQFYIRTSIRFLFFFFSRYCFFNIVRLRW